jgi:SAM-dependent methyltransferase
MTSSTASQSAQTEALVERLFTAAIDTLEVASVDIGGRLGFYRSLADDGDASPAELANRTGTAERYVREWLEQQAIAGFLTVDDPDAAPGERRYDLPTAYRPVLVDEESLSLLTPLATLAIGVCAPMKAVLEAYRTGRGVPFDAYDIHEATGAINRPQYVNLVADWLGSIPEVDARLRSGRPARVADLACGTAWSSIAIARAYPAVTVDAIDEDTASIEAAHANVTAAGLADRVRPIVRDASAPELDGPYDLVTIFEALHDMNHPVEALRTARRALADGGSVLVADERVAERFSAPGDELERFNYGWSILHCLAVGLMDEDSAGTGTVMRPDTVRAYATEAGFGGVEVLPSSTTFGASTDWSRHEGRSSDGGQRQGRDQPGDGPRGPGARDDRVPRRGRGARRRQAGGPLPHQGGRSPRTARARAWCRVRRLSAARAALRAGRGERRRVARVPDLPEREGPRGLGARAERPHRRRDAVVGVGGGGTGDGVQLLSTRLGSPPRLPTRRPPATID